MNEALKNSLFDVIISEAFSRCEKEYLTSLPPEEELNERYPLPEKELRSVQRYHKKAEKMKKYGGRLVFVYLRRAAVIVLTVLSLAFGAMMLNGEVRAAVENVFIHVFDRFTRFEFNSGQTGSDEDTLSIYDFDVISNVPEEYGLVSVKENKQKRSFSFTDGEGGKLYVEICYGTVQIQMDNEHSIIEKIEIDGNTAYKQVTIEEEPSFVGIFVAKSNIIIDVLGSESEEKMVEVTEAIVKSQGNR